MVADRLMQKQRIYRLRKLLPRIGRIFATGLAEAEKCRCVWLSFCGKHRHDSIHYFIGAGNQWGAVYSYAMCYWEEQSWLRSKSIHAESSYMER